MDLYGLALRIFYPNARGTFIHPEQVRFFPHALSWLGILTLWLTGLTVYLVLRP